MGKKAPKLTKEEQEREDRKKSVYHDKSAALVKKNIRNVQVAFGEFSTVGFMGGQQFEVFAQEMNLPSHDITRRLFMAFDDDNTGALDHYEFFLGLRRVMSDCHLAVQLNHFIPGFLSYSVAVFLK